MIRSWILACLALLIAGTQSAVAIDHEPFNDPSADYISDVSFYVLEAELADQRGLIEQASQAYFQAAERSGLPELASKAAYYALRRGLYVNAWDAALVWLRIESFRPNSAQPRIVLGLALLGLEREEPALEQFQLALLETNDQDLMYRQLSSELSLLSNIDSLAIYDQLISDDNAQNYFYRGLLTLKLKQIDESMRSVNRALSIDPDNENAALLKFNLLNGRLATNDVSDTEIRDFAKQFIKRNSKSTRFRQQYAEYLVSQKAYHIALEQYKLVLEIEDNEHTAAPIYYAAMLLSVELGDFDLAQNYANHLQNQPGYEERTLFFLCEIEFEQGKLEQAQEHCSNISDPEYYFDAQLVLAEILAKQGHLEQALHFLSDVSVVDEENKLRLILKQQQLLYDGRHFRRAKGILDAAIISNPNQASLLYARGIVLAEIGYIRAHENDMRQVIELEPNNAHAYNALGYTLADRTDRYDEAFELIQKANQLRPNDPFILDSLGWVRYRQNKFTAAVKYLEQAYSLKADPEIAAHLGEVYWLLGEHSKAKDVWKQGLTVDPMHPLLNQTILKFNP